MKPKSYLKQLFGFKLYAFNYCFGVATYFL